jgi:crotonobetainyl-CoA:carnitine CoA-transferase CaiB-like acyl-CoA transferase
MYRFRTLTLSECVQMFAASPLPHGPVNTIAEAFAHEQIQYNKLIKTMPHPTAGSIRVVGGCARAHKHTRAVQVQPCITRTQSVVYAHIRHCSVSTLNTYYAPCSTWTTIVWRN